MRSRYSPKTKNNVGFTQHKNVDIAKGKAFAILSGHVPVQVTIEIRQHINDFLSRDSLAGEEVMLMVCTFDHDSYASATDPGSITRSIALYGDLRTARIVERILPTVDSKFALFFTMWHRNTPYFIVPIAMDKVSHLTCDVGIYTDKPVEHLSVNMLVPFWGGMEVDMDERKKQELVKIKGRMQVARARARSVRTLNAVGKHMRNHSHAATNTSPLLFNNPLGLTRSLMLSQSHPSIPVARTHTPRHTGNSPHISIAPRPSSPLSPNPRSPRSPRISPNSPPVTRSPRPTRANTNTTNNNNILRSPNISTNPSRSPNANNNLVKSPLSQVQVHGSPTKSPNNIFSSPFSPSSSASTKIPTSPSQGQNYYSKYKEKMKYMKQLVKLKDEELARVRDEMSELLSGNKKSSNTSYFDFLPNSMRKNSNK